MPFFLNTIFLRVLLSKSLPRHWFRTSFSILACVLLITACSPSSTQSNALEATEPPAATPTELPSPPPPPSIPSNSPDSYGNLPRLNGQAVVEMTINNGLITFTIDGENAPITAGNFVDLVSQGFYDDLSFHRVVRDPQPFVVQGGDPQSRDPNFPANNLGAGGYKDPTTGQERSIPLEIRPASGDEILYGKTFQMASITGSPKLPHTRGALAMARSQFPDSASSQFYVALADLSFLDGNYAVFGYVTEGMDVVDQIQQGDRIQSMRVVSGLENLVKPE